jgi:hypothetical protein
MVEQAAEEALVQVLLLETVEAVVVVPFLCFIALLLVLV